MKEAGVEHISEENLKPEDIILQIRQEVYLMGANDVEMTDFNNILGKLQRGECSAEEAIEAARAIQMRKMDYH